MKRLSNRLSKPGFSLVEVLVAMAIFGTAIAGLYMAITTMNESIMKAMQRDVESAYLNALIAEINPFDPLIETSFDVTTKTAYSLPSGDSFFYTRIVDSATTTPDVKQVNVYVYRTSGATTPYRIIRREITPLTSSFNLGETTAYYKSDDGTVWAPLSGTTANYSGTNGSRRNGRTETHTQYTVASAITGTPDQALFQKGEASNNGSNKLGFRFLATVGKSYLLTIGSAEVAGATSGQRIMDVSVNGSVVGTFDAAAEAGANVALTKTYSVSPADIGGGMGTVLVELTRSTGATQNPRLAFISLKAQN